MVPVNRAVVLSISCPARVCNNNNNNNYYYYYYFLLRVLCPFQSTAVVLRNSRAVSRLVSRDPYAVVMCSERELHHFPSHASIFRRRGASVPPPRSTFLARRMLPWNLVALWLGNSWIVMDKEPTSVQVNDVRRTGSAIQGMELIIAASGRCLDSSHIMCEVGCGYYLTSDMSDSLLHANWIKREWCWAENCDSK
jgi:hypothetical protein